MGASESGKRQLQLGPTGERIRKNVRHFRDLRRLTTRRLSEVLRDEIGHPMQATAVTKIEAGERRVDVDDLVALALALDVSPMTLLLPPSQEADQRVSVMPNRDTPWRTAWHWMHGEHPYWEPRTDRQVRGDDDIQWSNRLRRFIDENKPYENPNLVREIDQFLSSRLEGAWHLEMDHDSDGTTTSALSLHSVREAGRKAEQEGDA